MFHYGTCTGCRCPSLVLIVLLAVGGGAGDATAAPLPLRTSGLGEGLLVRVLLGMHLVIHEFIGHLVAVVDFQLREGMESKREALHLDFLIGG